MAVEPTERWRSTWPIRAATRLPAACRWRRCDEADGGAPRQARRGALLPRQGSSPRLASSQRTAAAPAGTPPAPWPNAGGRGTSTRRSPRGIHRERQLVDAVALAMDRELPGPPIEVIEAQ